MSSVSPLTIRVCLSSFRYSGVISRGDSISSPDLIIWSNSADVGINSILADKGRAVESLTSPRQLGCCRAAVAIAQLAEHQIVDLGVAGSSPASHPIPLLLNSSALGRWRRAAA